jgi:YggT family protein
MGVVYVVMHWIIQVFILLVIAQAILSFFMDPYHPVRRTLDQIVAPFLNPIRRVVPPLANLDFSPIVLIILLQVLDVILNRLFHS